MYKYIEQIYVYVQWAFALEDQKDCITQTTYSIGLRCNRSPITHGKFLPSCTGKGSFTNAHSRAWGLTTKLLKPCSWALLLQAGIQELSTQPNSPSWKTTGLLTAGLSAKMPLCAAQGARIAFCDAAHVEPGAAHHVVDPNDDQHLSGVKNRWLSRSVILTVNASAVVRFDLLTRWLPQASTTRSVGLPRASWSLQVCCSLFVGGF